MPFYEAAVAEAEAQAGDIVAALTRLERALAEIEQTGERWCEGEIHRVRGEIFLKSESGDAARREDAFLTAVAVAVARAQRARSFELRAALVS
jgi:predicted ATPase